MASDKALRGALEAEPADELAGAARKLLGLSIDLIKRDGFPPTHAYHDALVALRRALPDSFVPSAATGGLVDAAPDPPPEAELCIDCGSTRTSGHHEENPEAPYSATLHRYQAPGSPEAGVARVLVESAIDAEEITGARVQMEGGELPTFIELRITRALTDWGDARVLAVLAGLDTAVLEMAHNAERTASDEPPEAGEVPAEVVAEQLAEKFAPGHVLAAKHQIHTAMRDYRVPRSSRTPASCPHCGRPLGLIRETPDA